MWRQSGIANRPATGKVVSKLLCYDEVVVRFPVARRRGRQRGEDGAANKREPPSLLKIIGRAVPVTGEYPTCLSMKAMASSSLRLQGAVTPTAEVR